MSSVLIVGPLIEPIFPHTYSIMLSRRGLPFASTVLIASLKILIAVSSVV